MERTMIIESLEEMCDLMCGGVEIDYDEENDEENEIVNTNNKEWKVVENYVLFILVLYNIITYICMVFISK